MRIYRKNVFETNSSSCHTLNIGAKPEPGSIPNLTEKTLELELQEFGWSGSCSTWEEKLAYLFILIWCTSRNSPGDLWYVQSKDEYDKAVAFVKNTDDWERIWRIVQEATGAKDLNVFGEGYIDHQSFENYKSLGDWLEYKNLHSDEDVKNFLFGDSYIDIDNDNH